MTFNFKKINIILDNEMKYLSEEEKIFYKKYSFSPSRYKCNAYMNGKIENFFAFFNKGEYFILYDDIEGEFALGKRGGDGFISFEGTDGTLAVALRRLLKQTVDKEGDRTPPGDTTVKK